MRLKRTPCVGICSTTYGDLVCRGCKRFAHEITGWNGFTDSQRERVWDRLLELRDGAALSCVRIESPDALACQAAHLKVPDASELTPGNLAYEVIRRSRREDNMTAAGLLPRNDDADFPALFRRIEQELLLRSQAHYERYFHVAAQ